MFKCFLFSPVEFEETLAPKCNVVERRPKPRLPVFALESREVLPNLVVIDTVQLGPVQFLTGEIDKYLGETFQPL